MLCHPQFVLALRWMRFAVVVLSVLTLDGCFTAQAVVIRWVLIVVLS
jgi:hypothetical protein